MFKIKKSFCKMVVAALLTLTVLASCSPSKPTPQFKLRIGSFPGQTYLPYYVMDEQGFAKKNGLQFTETSYQGSVPIVEAMVSGSVDMGYLSSLVVISAAGRGLIPGTILPVAANEFSDADHPGLAILVAPSINAWKDLEGQRIAVIGMTSVPTLAIKGRLKKERVDNYKLEEIPVPNMGLALAGGNVAAAVMSEPFLTQSLLRGDGKFLGWLLGEPPFERIGMTMIVFRADFYRNNPQAVKAFLRSQLQAVKYMNQNQEGVRSILAKRMSLSGEVSKKIKLLHWPLDTGYLLLVSRSLRNH
jgi:ABC-type nitrate/sulfonate/bicarbonate transport system substrate-binding protein